MGKPKKRRKFIVFSLIGLVLVALTLVAAFKKREPVTTVQTEKVVRTNITETVKANGLIRPVVQVSISPEVSGEIIDLPVKAGQHVEKGDLLVRIKPDFYTAALNQARAQYESSIAGKAQSEANLLKAEAEFKRNKLLFDGNLISESDFVSIKAAYDVARAQAESSLHQVEMAKASVASAQDSLDKTTILSPLAGTVITLNSQLGERVLGTVQNVGTEIMTLADLNEMEARVEIGEMDVVLINPGQKAHLEVDAFKDRKFLGTVTQVANSSAALNLRRSTGMSSSSSQEAIKFEVRIHIQEKEFFRPGMSVTAEIETRYRTNVLAVPLASVTTRKPKNANKDKTGSETNAVKGSATRPPGTNTDATTAAGSTTATQPRAESKDKPGSKLIEVVFMVDGERAKMIPVTRGIGDENFWEITDGLAEGQEIVTGGYRAVGRDLEDGKKIRKGAAAEQEEAKD